MAFQPKNNNDSASATDILRASRLASSNANEFLESLFKATNSLTFNPNLCSSQISLLNESYNQISNETSLGLNSEISKGIKTIVKDLPEKDSPNMQSQACALPPKNDSLIQSPEIPDIIEFQDPTPQIQKPMAHYVFPPSTHENAENVTPKIKCQLKYCFDGIRKITADTVPQRFCLLAQDGREKKINAEHNLFLKTKPNKNLVFRNITNGQETEIIAADIIDMIVQSNGLTLWKKRTMPDNLDRLILLLSSPQKARELGKFFENHLKKELEISVINVENGTNEPIYQTCR